MVGVFCSSLTVLRCFAQLNRRANEILTAWKNESRTPMNEREGNFCVHAYWYLFYPESLLLEERDLKISTTFLSIPSRQWHTYAPRTRTHHKFSRTVLTFNVHVQETKRPNKEKTHSFSGRHGQVSTRLRTGETWTEIPERNRIECSCNLSCRSTFPNYCAICSDSDLQLHSLKITRLRKRLLSQVKDDSFL